MSQGLDSMDVSQLSDADKRELQTFIANETQKATVQDSIHGLAETCFKKCITSAPKSGQLDRYEQPCIQNCVGRFLDSQTLVLKRMQNMQGGS